MKETIGICSVCNVPRILREDGTTSTHSWPPLTHKTCKGSRKLPKESSKDSPKTTTGPLAYEREQLRAAIKEWYEADSLARRAAGKTPLFAPTSTDEEVEALMRKEAAEDALRKIGELL